MSGIARPNLELSKFAKEVSSQIETLLPSGSADESTERSRCRRGRLGRCD